MRRTLIAITCCLVACKGGQDDGGEFATASTTNDTTDTSPGDGAGAGDGDGDGDGESTDTGFKFDVATDVGIDKPDESTCEKAAESLTSAGCRFAPVVGNQNFAQPWAVVAANANVKTANVTLYSKDGAELGSAQIDPGELEVFVLEGNSSELTSHQTGATTMVSKTAMLLESDIPIVAYQFTPYSVSQVATADASMLLPEHAWDTDYLTALFNNDGTIWLEVVSLEDQNEITVTAPDFFAGATVAGGGMPALSAGQSSSVNIDTQEVLRVAAPSGGTADLTGFRVQSTKPVSVFVGSPSMSIPGPGMNYYKDYLEEQLPPRSAWGTDYAAIKYRPRSNEVDIYRFVADKDGTTIELSGDYQDTLVLDAGEFEEVQTAESFFASSEQAFMGLHIMVSQDQATGPKDDQMYPGDGMGGNCSWDGATTQLGDPAIDYLVPVDQFRFNYTFLTPATYSWDMMTVIAPESKWQQLMLDGAPLAEQPTSLGVGGWGYARFLIEDGPHEISADTPFGIDVYGYDCRISYAYPGGLNLRKINDPEG